MKKMMLLAAAAVLALQAVPAFAEHGEGKHHDRGTKMFEKFDADKNGVISAQESADAAKKKFDEMDANKDGGVTKEEADAHHAAMKAKWKEMKAKKDAEKPVEGTVAPKAE